MKQSVGKVLLIFLQTAGVIQRAVDIGAAVVEGGEEEARFRCGQDPVGAEIAEGSLGHVVAQGGLGQLHRAHGAQKIGIDLAGSIGLGEVVPAAVGHVVGVVGQQDQIVAFDGEGLDRRLVKIGDGFVVLQGGIPQTHQPPVLGAAHHLLGGKGQLRQIFADAAGKAFAQQREQLFRLAFAHQGQGLVKFGDDFPPLVDITAADAVDRMPVGAQPPAQLAEFSFVHGSHPLVGISAPRRRRKRVYHSCRREGSGF